MGEIWDKIWRYLYIALWKVAWDIRLKVAVQLRWVIAIAAIAEGLGVVLHLFFHDHQFPPQVQLWISIILAVATISLLIHHRFLESSLHRHRVLLENMRGFLDQEAITGDSFSAYAKKVLISVNPLMRKRHSSRPRYDTALGDPEEIHSAVLKVSGDELSSEVCEPRVKHFEELELPLQKSACGYAANNGCIVFVPSTKHRHGIKISSVEERKSNQRYKNWKLEIVEDVLVEKDPPFKSLLSAPIPHKTVSPSKLAYGVVLITSKQSNAFKLFQVDIINLVAFVLEMKL